MDQPFLPYCRPFVDDREIDALQSAVRNGWLTTGPKVAEFESAFALRTGRRHAIALNSCTAALHVALAAVGVGPGDEVVMPSLTFVAGAQCTLELGAKPVFCDVDPNTLTAGIAQFETALTARTKAIIAMPYGGRPLGMRALAQFARQRGVTLIEDAAHAAGMLDDGEWAGAHSAAAAYSFYATKNLTTAEGGMLVTDDDLLAERVRALSLHGMNRDAWKRYTAGGSWRYDVTTPGYKYNMPDTAAIMGLVQLERLDAMQARRRELAARYGENLRGLPGVSLQADCTNPADRHSWCMFVARIDRRRAHISRDDLIERLKDEGIGTSVHYIPTHLFTAYRSLGNAALPHTERVWEELISLPLYPGMTDGDVDRVCLALRKNVCLPAAKGTLGALAADIAAV